ncbi:MAG: hypothetical protein U0869_25430 [Chloroflexota bacterium]
MTDNDQQPVPWGERGDNFLEILVDMANRVATDGFWPVTLFVGGQMVTGYIASGRAYFEAIGQELVAGLVGSAEDDDQEPAATLVKFFAQMGDTYPDRRAPGEAATDDASEPDKPEPRFIHLSGARVITPGQPAIPMNRPVWWRGRLDKVDGFIVGTLSTD